MVVHHPGSNGGRPHRDETFRPPGTLEVVQKSNLAASIGQILTLWPARPAMLACDMGIIGPGTGLSVLTRGLHAFIVGK